MGTRPPLRTAKVIRRYVTAWWEGICFCVLGYQDKCIDIVPATASVDPKDPNADLHALLGITDK